MITIAVIVPEEEQVEFVSQIFHEHSRCEATEDDPAYSVNIHAAKSIRDVPRQALLADAVITCGMVSVDLKRLFPHTPLVELPLGGELAAAVLRAVEAHGRQPMAIIGSCGLISASRAFASTLGVDLREYIPEGSEDFFIRRAVDRALRDGHGVFVCGPDIQEHLTARDCRCHAVRIEKMSIWYALTQARRQALSYRRERERTAQLQAVLDSAQDGIIACDDLGRVTVFNASAAAILDISPALAIGRQINSILPIANDHLACRSTRNTSRFTLKNGKLLSVKTTKVRIADNNLGCVFTVHATALSCEETSR